MKTRVLDELHDSNLSTKVGDFVNETIDIINTEANHRFLRKSTTFSTVASQQDYTISSDVATDLDFFTGVTTRNPDVSLVEYSKTNFLDHIPDPTTQGNSPWAYYVQDDTLTIFPSPDAVMTMYVDYISFQSDLSGDTDIPGIPRQWTDLIVDGAVARGLKHQRPGAPAVWEPQMRMFFEKLKRMAAKSQRKPNQRLRFRSATDGGDSRMQAPEIELYKS